MTITTAPFKTGQAGRILAGRHRHDPTRDDHTVRRRNAADSANPGRTVDNDVSRRREVHGRSRPPRGATMNIPDMNPGLDAEALTSVRIDATRLSASGASKRKDQARNALVLIDAEEARRLPALPPAPPKSRKKVATEGSPKTRKSNAAS